MSSSSQPLDIRQEAAFAYLKEIQAFYRDNSPIFRNNKTPYAQLELVLKECDSKINQSTFPDYNVNYSELYTRFQEATEKVARLELNNASSANNAKLDPFFKRVFENDNKIHNKVAAEVVTPNENSSHKASTQQEVAENMKRRTTDPNKVFDIRHPDNKLNAFFSSMIGFGYNPLKRNNIPYMNYEQNELPNKRKSLRIGSQTQGEGEVNPTFKRYLLANARTQEKTENKDESTNNQQSKKYDYVYISLLKRSQEEQDTKKKGIPKLLDKFVRYSEGKRANALESLNFDKRLKTAAITLPADGEFFLGNFSMEKGMSKDATKNTLTNAEDLLKQLKANVRGNKNDFYMTNDVKNRLFGSNLSNGKFDELYKKSIEQTLGKEALQGQSLSDIKMDPEQRSAVLFQFVKSNLTDHILETLDPKAYNMSCKDAIDRGGIHSLWYHMNLQNNQGKPMSEAEFTKQLDTPALVVKYRPLNDNRNLLWNALKHRIENDPDFKANHSWAQKWVDQNEPKAVKEYRASVGAQPSSKNSKANPDTNGKDLVAELTDRLNVRATRIHDPDSVRPSSLNVNKSEKKELLQSFHTLYSNKEKFNQPKDVEGPSQSADPPIKKLKS